MVRSGLSQVEIAGLLGRHKGWVSRRMGMVERLHPEAVEAVKTGLIGAGAARRLLSLPAGNQVEMATGHPQGLRAHASQEACAPGSPCVSRRIRACRPEVDLSPYTVLMDGVPTPVVCFSFVLGYSRWPYVRFLAHADAQGPLASSFLLEEGMRQWVRRLQTWL
jgi:hypothetical protein